MYEYRCKVLKVIDGDTVDVDIDLGFGIVLKDERVRLMGIDTPESRTRDKVEKQFGLASKKRLKEMLDNKSGPILKTQINKKGEDMKGKFGRILGNFNVYCPKTDSWRMEDFKNCRRKACIYIKIVGSKEKREAERFTKG